MCQDNKNGENREKWGKMGENGGKWGEMGLRGLGKGISPARHLST